MQEYHTLHKLLLDEAHAQGFPLAGALDLEKAQPFFEEHAQVFEKWTQAGFAGSMEYLLRKKEFRKDPKLLFPGAKSIFCVAQPYSAESVSPPKYARYLRGRDYHLEIREKLETVMQKVVLKWSKELEWKICVDTSALLERSWAALAGLGWIGKNTLLIHPQYGSYLCLGEVLLNQATGLGPKLLPNYCGNCTRCLKACPTEAFVKERVLDSRKCISYLTLEKRGPLKISENEKKKMGSWIAGCDICQEVCPFNTKAQKTAYPQEDPALLQDWEMLMNETEVEYKERVGSSALNRIKYSDFRRNLEIALGNRS